MQHTSAQGESQPCLQAAGMDTSNGKKEQILDDMAKTHPLGRVGQPSDVASLALFLADGKRAEWLTGEHSWMC